MSMRNRVKIIELDNDEPAPIKEPVQRSLPKSMQAGGTSIYLAIPAYGCLVHNSFASSLLTLQIESIKRGIPIFIDMLGNESLIQRARNILLARFLKSSASHLMFIDSDIAFEANTVFRALEYGKPCVSCAYPKKMLNFDTVVEKVKAGDSEAKNCIQSCGLDYNVNVNIAPGQSVTADNGFLEVLDAATGFLLMERGLLERMCKKHKDLTVINDIISSREDIPTYVDLFECIRDPVDDKGNKRLLSEDYSFSRKVQGIGEKVYMDIGSVLAHSGNMIFSGDIRDRLEKKVSYSFA